jgi:hypothetical protein
MRPFQFQGTKRKRDDFVVASSLNDNHHDTALNASMRLLTQQPWQQPSSTVTTRMGQVSDYNGAAMAAANMMQEEEDAQLRLEPEAVKDHGSMKKAKTIIPSNNKNNPFLSNTCPTTTDSSIQRFLRARLEPPCIVYRQRCIAQEEQEPRSISAYLVSRLAPTTKVRQSLLQESTTPSLFPIDTSRVQQHLKQQEEQLRSCMDSGQLSRQEQNALLVAAATTRYQQMQQQQLSTTARDSNTNTDFLARLYHELGQQQQNRPTSNRYAHSNADATSLLSSYFPTTGLVEHVPQLSSSLPVAGVARDDDNNIPELTSPLIEALLQRERETRKN